jgi:hypothetical protein
MPKSSHSLPAWGKADLPEPYPLSWRHWTRFIGPGIVMMGAQIGGGEWLLGPNVTARYGGGLMWVATIGILVQVFYNLECGRYALYSGEPVFTGFMRMRPGPGVWIGLMLLLNSSALIPALSTNGAAVIAALWLDRPPTADDSWLVMGLAYACIVLVTLPALVGGKVYNMLQAVMTVKVVLVLGFCLLVGICFVEPLQWWQVFSGFVKFGNVPVADASGRETVVNAVGYYWEHGTWPAVALANIALLGAFAGYAGGGGLSNSTYSNFVRDKGWGMGSRVGAIGSAVGGTHVTLSHAGVVFPITSDNLRRWRGWWRYILMDQTYVWAPGCFIGMAMPALLSIHFAAFSNLSESVLAWAQALITADGKRNASRITPALTKLLWVAALFTGIAVLLPSQMAIVDDFSRRWTDAIWTASGRVRATFRPHQARLIYYGILGSYALWTFVCAYLFSVFGTPKLMVIINANMFNLAIGVTAIQLLWINHTLLPREIRPRWYHSLGVASCAIFYLGLVVLVLAERWPEIVRILSGAA